MPDQYLSHFTCLQFTEHYWQQPAAQRQPLLQKLAADLSASLPAYALLQLFPTRCDADLLLWSTFPITAPDQPAENFAVLGKLLNKRRAFLRPVESYWGFNRPSDYAKGKSSQEIDPFAPNHKKYLVVYPFTKTSEWYQFSRDARQGMMNEHIRLGHQYPQIIQLLLYSTGLQDQEFIVAYETDELQLFSTLVSELRMSDARPFTLRDTPIYSAVYRSTEEVLNLFL